MLPQSDDFSFKRWLKYILGIEIVYVVSRLLLYRMGVQFDSWTLLYSLQFVDPYFLKNDLFRSIFYLHSQPPLLNLVLGILLKIFPTLYPVICQYLFLILGQLLYISLFLLMVRMGVKAVIAFVLSTCFMLSPAVILYENLLFYEYPAVAVMTAAALFLNRYLHQQRFRDGFLFFLMLAFLVLMKSYFHLVWFLFIMVFIKYFAALRWRDVLRVGLIPLILVLIFYVKNLIVFHEFTLSKVVMVDSLLNTVAKYVPKNDYLKYYDSGDLSVFTAHRVLAQEFGREDDYEQALIKLEEEYAQVPKTGVLILDRLENVSAPTDNWNSLYRLRISDDFLKDSIFLLKKYPSSYLRSVQRSYFYYFLPGPTDFSTKNRAILEGYENNCNFMFRHLNTLNGGELYSDLQVWHKVHEIKWDMLAVWQLYAVAAFYVVLNIFGVRKIILLMALRSTQTPFGGTLCFIMFNIFYLFMIGTFLTWLGNNRYRFNIEPFYWLLFGLLLTTVLEKIKLIGRGRHEA